MDEQKKNKRIKHIKRIREDNKYYIHVDIEKNLKLTHDSILLDSHGGFLKQDIVWLVS